MNAMYSNHLKAHLVEKKQSGTAIRCVAMLRWDMYRLVHG
ncbi:hypothetical protein CPter291_0236 [Collimonas pratensis]|uniref:Transposase n=1 Tax=Collimonas pratensis TaxID=279113 RepID=A0ABM5Z0K8_9BURK|nr:hypothetical protein CPter291_0236 [Collimonas pratensis]